MSAMSPLAATDPRMVAWNAFIATHEFHNAYNWLAHEQHRQGSMWAAFIAGWDARASPLPAGGAEPDLTEELIERVKLLDRLLVEHHSASIMREEHDSCPVCTIEMFGKTGDLLRRARLTRSPRPDRKDAEPPNDTTGAGPFTVTDSTLLGIEQARRNEGTMWEEPE